MKKLPDILRLERLIDSAIEQMELDLTGLTVLTEAASGAFISTALAAAKAGASAVYAVTKSSAYGSADEVIDYGQKLAIVMGVEEKIHFSKKPAKYFAETSDIVTNLGFVRPIDVSLISKLPKHAVISLMWEPWEFRSSDIDLKSCRQAGIPIIATNETDPRLRTFEYVGMLAIKLLLEAGLECLNNRILVIGSDPFGGATERVLSALGADVLRLSLPDGSNSLEELYGDEIDLAEALILVEHKDHRELIGNNGLHPQRIKSSGCRVIHICGHIDYRAMDLVRLRKYPDKVVQPGYMTLTTDYLGLRPVVDLHIGGLRVGEIAVRCRRAGGSNPEAVDAAIRSGLGLAL